MYNNQLADYQIKVIGNISPTANLALSLLLDSVNEFYCSDYYSYLQYADSIEGMERSCAFRIGCYYRNKIEVEHAGEFKGYSVDMEFNRAVDGLCNHKKEIKVKNSIRETDKRSPDLIVHKRFFYDNLLICEFKTNNNQKEKDEDLKELEAATKHDKKSGFTSGYEIGVFIKLNKLPEKIETELYINGQNKGGV
jgi:hypothetical protein